MDDFGVVYDRTGSDLPPGALGALIRGTFTAGWTRRAEVDGLNSLVLSAGGPGGRWRSSGRLPLLEQMAYLDEDRLLRGL